MDQLSPRELHVAELVHGELTSAEIGRQLRISETTVKTHLVNIFRKLGVPSRVGVALWWERRLCALHFQHRAANG